MNLKNKFFRFLSAGVINSVATYLVYTLLVLFLSYQASYAVAFAFGIVLSFVLNTKYVFEVVQTKKKFVLFPLVYFVQYLLGAILLNFLIEIIGINKFFAPLFIAVCLLPVSYLLSKKILNNTY
jgi:putative flippase GtrA